MPIFKDRQPSFFSAQKGGIGKRSRITANTATSVNEYLCDLSL